MSMDRSLKNDITQQLILLGTASATLSKKGIGPDLQLSSDEQTLKIRPERMMRIRGKAEKL
jgi:hypothetical protein